MKKEQLIQSKTLRQARKEEGLTQRQVADKAHIPEVSYQRYELGLVEPKARVANRISTALNRNPIDLFGT